MLCKLLLVDDHPVVREGLRSIVSHDPSLRIAAEASSGQEALSLVATLEPDVVLVDINLPDGSGIEVTRRIKSSRPSTVVIVLTVYDTETYLIEAIQAGASGYLIKGSAQDLVLQAIRVALQGGMVVQRDLLSRAMASLPAPADPAMAPQLTVREREVLELLARGHTNRQMASELHLAEVTVKKHVQTLMSKLGASDRTQAALTALRTRLVS